MCPIQAPNKSGKTTTKQDQPNFAEASLGEASLFPTKPEMFEFQRSVAVRDQTRPGPTGIGDNRLATFKQTGEAPTELVKGMPFLLTYQCLH